MGKTAQLEALENTILDNLYDLALNPEITSFEREKVIIAKNLLEKGVQYYTVLRRLQITFMSTSVRGELSTAFSEFYKKLPDYIEQEGKVQVGFVAGAFLAPPMSL